MRLIFVRHGESTANLLHEFSNRGWKHPLTETGRQQAEILAARLAVGGVTRIFSSPLMRAVQTAEILSAALGLDYQVNDALREYDVGDYEGSRAPDGWALYNQVDQAWREPSGWDERMPGGESFNDVQARFLPFIAGLVGRYGQSGERVVLVSHGGLYRIMLPLALVNVSADFTHRHPIPAAGQVTAELGSRGLECVAWWQDEGPGGGFSAA